MMVMMMAKTPSLKASNLVLFIISDFNASNLKTFLSSERGKKYPDLHSFAKINLFSARQHHQNPISAMPAAIRGELVKQKHSNHQT
jgi:hypothetical protein